MNIEYKKHTLLLIINGKHMSLPGPIWNVFEYQNHALVTLDPAYGMRNMFCYDENGDLLWTIERAEFFKHEGPGYEGAYTEKIDGVENVLMALCRGRPFFLDIDTGKVTFIPGIPDRM